MKFIKKHLGLILTLQSLTVIKLSVIFVIALSVYPCYSGESWYIYPDEDVPDIGQRHGMMQDSRGIIWFWGELGVVSYDAVVFDSSHRRMDSRIPIPIRWLKLLMVRSFFVP